MRGLQHGGDQAGGRGLAVRAADRDRPFQPHQFGQHLGAPHHRDQPRAGAGDLRIVRLHRGRHDDDLGAAEVGGVMADGDRDAGLAQPADIGGIGDVAALHRVAEVMQHLGDARHADAADADEMDGADGKRQRSHAPASWRMRSSTRSASRAVASGRAMLRAARAAWVSMSGGCQQRREPVAQCAGGEIPLRDHRCAARPRPARAHWPTDGRRSRQAAAPGSPAARRPPVRPRWRRRHARSPDAPTPACPATSGKNAASSASMPARS